MCGCISRQRVASGAVRILRMSTSHASADLIDSRFAAWRLLTVLGLVTLGNSSMYAISVVLPAVQAEFGVSRAEPPCLTP